MIIRKSVVYVFCFLFFFFSSRRRHTRCLSDWSSDVCSSDLISLVRSVAHQESVWPKRPQIARNADGRPRGRREHRLRRSGPRSLLPPPKAAPTLHRRSQRGSNRTLLPRELATRCEGSLHPTTRH